MLPFPQQKYNRQIDISEKVYEIYKNPDSFWVITLLGNSFWEDDRIQQEVVITNVTNKEYNFKESRNGVKLYMPEVKTNYFSIWFDLGKMV